MVTYKILIIDDLIENLKTIVSIFEKYLPDYEVFQTNNPENAIEIAIQTNPDLIITDWEMPQISGLELMQLFKENKDTKSIPIIMATGVMLEANDLKIALDAGAIDYIRKPINAVELIARTNSALLLTNYYNQIVNQKDEELTETSLHLVKSHEYINSFVSKLTTVENSVLENPNDAINQLSSLKIELLQSVDEVGWYSFDLSFSKVHKSFKRNLTEKHPNITPAELKLCSFIRLGMSNKEIASVLNQSPDSVKVSRYRIRKKIKIESGINLESYLLQF